MEFRTKKIKLSEAKAIDLVQYLSSLGYEPAKVRNYDHWYLSPLRNEKTPSFKVNRKLNCWYDHGIGTGGNLIDFAVAYHGYTIVELLEKLGSKFFLHQPRLEQPRALQKLQPAIELVSDHSISSFVLLKYLTDRCIAIQIADKYCREIRYQIGEKIYYGIGFKNDSSGYEIRNSYCKLSSSPKGITTLNNGSNEVVVFEGFMDFLSFKTIFQNEAENRFDFVILNSLSFFESARPFMEKHQRILLYLDNDAAGQNCSRHAHSLSDKYSDESKLYRGYKDLNDWLINFGRSQKTVVRKKDFLT